MNRPRTRPATAYRLVPTVRGSHEDMFDAYTQYVDVRALDERRADVDFIEIAGVPAIWIGIQDDEKPGRMARGRSGHDRAGPAVYASAARVACSSSASTTSPTR